MCIKFTLLKDREAVIKSLTHWIDSNLYRPITVLDVARKSGYSLAYIQRNFRQECGISIGLYIRSRKLEKAAHMLRHTQLSVSDIFTMLGYEAVNVQQSVLESIWALPNQIPRAG